MGHERQKKNLENEIKVGINCTKQSMMPFFSQQILKILFQAEDWPWTVDSATVRQCTEKCEVNDFVSGFVSKFLAISLPSFHFLAHRYSG